MSRDVEFAVRASNELCRAYMLAGGQEGGLFGYESSGEGGGGSKAMEEFTAMNIERVGMWWGSIPAADAVARARRAGHPKPPPRSSLPAPGSLFALSHKAMRHGARVCGVGVTSLSPPLRLCC